MHGATIYDANVFLQVIYRYAGVIERPQVEPNHLARIFPVRLLVLKRHQEPPMPRGKAPREASKVRIDLGQIQHLNRRRDSVPKEIKSTKGMDTSDVFDWKNALYTKKDPPLPPFAAR